MKVEIIEAAPVPGKSNYPYLGITTDGLVVLFDGKNRGTVIKTSRYWRIGFHCHCFDESNFTPFTGTVQLSND